MFYRFQSIDEHQPQSMANRFERFNQSTVYLSLKQIIKQRAYRTQKTLSFFKQLIRAVSPAATSHRVSVLDIEL